jgi:hypothetical protein
MQSRQNVFFPYISLSVSYFRVAGIEEFPRVTYRVMELSSEHR